MASKIKKCTKCKEDKPFDQFYKSPSSKDGLMYWCKMCSNQVRENNKNKNLAKHRDTARRYEELHKEKRREQSRLSYQRTKDVIRERGYTDPKYIYKRLVQSAADRGRKVTMTKEEFCVWWNQQIKICVYCGIPEQYVKYLPYIHKMYKNRLTIDRIDNLYNYSLDNMHLVCGVCNQVKNTALNDLEMKTVGTQILRPKWEHIIRLVLSEPIILEEV